MWRLSLVFVIALAFLSDGLIHSPPQIIKQPISGEMLFRVAGFDDTEKPFIIDCEAKGEPASKYRWIKDGKHFEFTGRDHRIIQQPGRGTLIITRPRNEDSGQYQCFAENEHGVATSNSVLVRKSELNNFKDEAIRTLEVDEGSPFMLECQSPDGWPKPSVNWIVQTSFGEIKSINNSRITVDPEGNLWFSNVTHFDASDDSYYACLAASTFRYDFKLGNRIMLKVLAANNAAQNRIPPIRQYVSRRNELALRGQKIEIFCIYGGSPLPQTVWSKDGRLISWSDRITQGNYGKSLIIRHTEFDDKGSYTCDVSNGVGQEQSASINLEIKAVPYFTKEPETQNVAEEETVEFECEAKGIPEPTIKWIHNGKPIEQSPPNPRRQVLKNKIIIRNLVKADTGNYGCNATNALGYVYKDVYVNVFSLSPEMEEGPEKEATVDQRDVTLTCREFGAPKPKIKWIRNGQELTGGRFKIQESGDLIIENMQIAVEGAYICQFGSKKVIRTLNRTRLVRENTRFTDVPYKNPDNVEGKGTEPNNLIIKWSPMASWKRAVAGADWNKQDIYEWERGELLIPDQPPFQRYKIRVQAVNEKGESNVAVKEVDGFSGEDKPTEAPKDLTLIQLVSGTSAMLTWEEVSPDSIRGHFRGYKIQTWVEDDEENIKEILVKSDSAKALVTNFTPDSVNYVRVMAFNDRFNGPPSNTISFKTPEGVPSIVQSMQAFPLGSSAFMLQWKRPLLTNGKLQGYRIYYEEVKGTEIGPRQEREPRILDPNVKQAKLAGLKSETKYRIHIVGFTKQGEGDDYYIEHKTAKAGSVVPDVPYFDIDRLESYNGYAKAKVTWRPNYAGTSGSHFYVQYRKSGESNYITSPTQISDDSIELGGLEPNEEYEFRVVSVDGLYETPSDIRRYDTSDDGGRVSHSNVSNATAGWFIGMTIALKVIVALRT